MAKHDIVTYNSTSKGFETELNDNTAQIKGEGDKIFSVESGSTEIFSVGIDNVSININSNITASGNISGSVTSTGSFGRIEATKLSGDASQMTNVNERTHVSGAAQIATYISGAFNAGFEIQGNLSGSATSSGSFGKVFANTYVGDVSLMTNVNEAGHFSSSAQMASNISGSFTSGFGYTGTISGSATSTGSFGRVKWTGQISATDASEVTNLNESGFISGAAQIATYVSGSFTSGFGYTGTISGSAQSTGSFGRLDYTNIEVTDEPDIDTPLQTVVGLVTSSAQLASSISGSFTSGFEVDGTISGSATSTGSFGRLDATTLVGDVSEVTNLPLTGIISSSAQIAAYISGSHTHGFSYSGTISGSGTNTGSFGRIDATTFGGDFSGVAAAEEGHFSGSSQLADQICGSFGNEWIFGGNENVSSYYVGVSGSQFMTASNATTMSIMSLCGTDYDYRICDEFSNKTSFNRIRGDVLPIANSAWTEVAPLPGIGGNGQAQVGTVDAALSAGGYGEGTPSPGTVDTTCKYDGSTWSNSATLQAARGAMASAGTQNAALIIAGRVTSTAATDTTERYNGSTWSEVNDLPSAMPAGAVGGFGTQNDAYAVGEVSEAADMFKFDGTAWSEAQAHITTRTNFGVDGTSNSAIMVGAYNPSGWRCSEIWNGSTWSEGSDLGNGSRGPTVSGTANSALIQGNHFQVNGGQTSCYWDGTAYSSTTRMITTRGFAARSGVGVSGDSMFIGGTGNQAPYTTKVTTTEHFQTINTTTASFYAIDAKSYSPRISRSIDVSGLTYSFSSPAKSLSDMSAGISGSFNHGFMFKNSISGSATTTGSLSNFKADKIVTSDMSIGSFTDTNQLPHQSSSFRSHTNKPHIIPYVADKFYDTRQYVPTGSGHKYSCGSCTAFSNGFDTSDGQLSIGRDGILNISFITASGVDSGLGKTPGAFSSLPNMITATRANTFGSTNAAVVVSGNTTNAENATTSHVQHFNGVSWRRGPDILVDRASPGGGQGWGQSEDDVSMNRSQTNATKREHMQYNGHTWWYMTCNNTTEQHGGAAGSQNSAIIFGGEAPAVATEEWNGHSWSAGGEMNVAKTG